MSVDRRRLIFRCFQHVSIAVLIVVAAEASAADKRLIGVPLHFEPNVGQADPAVRFIAPGSGLRVEVAPGEIALQIRSATPPSTPRPGLRRGRDLEAMLTQAPESAVVRMLLVDASPSAHFTAEDLQPSTTNYYLGNDPSKWKCDVPHFGRLVARGVYPGIDLVLHGRGGDLEYDFVVDPGADPASIVLPQSERDRPMAVLDTARRPCHEQAYPPSAYA